MHRRLTDKRLSRAHLRIQLSHSDCEGSQRTAKLKTQNAPLYHELLPVGYRDVYYIAMASGMPAYRLSGSAAWCVLRSSAKAMFCSMVGRRASWGIELVSTRADGRLDTRIPGTALSRYGEDGREAIVMSSLSLSSSEEDPMLLSEDRSGRAYVPLLKVRTRLT